MCGIAGYFNSDNSDLESLKMMTGCLAHRGPDADGFFTDAMVGLGHRRLSIIDLSAAANQPMFSHDNRYVIIFNGEVFNFKEVAKKNNIQCRTHSDTEVLIESFAKLGTDAIQDWNGMFAIAIYDKREEKLFLIRDRIGVKPLYYYQAGTTILFASEIKAIQSLPLLKNKLTLNKEAVRMFLNTGFIPAPHSIYNEIHKLPNGCYAEITKQKITINQYWKAEEKVYPVTIKNENEAKKELHRLIKSSVAYRMIADVPYGTFLSGGIDSSLVTAVAQSISKVPVKTFSIGFNESKYNESAYARQVSKHLGTDHYEFIVTENDALDLVEKMMDAYDEPLADGSCIPTMLVSKLARQHVTMALSGDGGDELFMGYGSYLWARRLQQPMLKFFRKPIAKAFSFAGNKFKRTQHLFRYKSEKDFKRNTFSQEIGFFADDELDRLMSIGMIEFDSYPVSSRKITVAEAQSIFDLNYYLKDDLLTKVDIASMQYSLEVRTPYLDYRIVEFALNLDESLKIKNDVPKYLLKQILYDYVPKEIFDRPKWGFSIPLSKWLKTDLKYLIDNNLNKDIIEKYNIVSYNEVNLYINKFMNGEDYVFNRIWALVLLHRWLKKNYIL